MIDLQQNAIPEPFSIFSDSFCGIINFKVLLDKRVLLVLKDGRKIEGIFKVYDQFGNITLTDATERIFIETQYGEKYQGILLIRGENVVLIGEYDDQAQQLGVSYPMLKKLPMKEIFVKQRLLAEERKRIIKAKRELNKEFGLLEADIMAEFDL